MTFAAEFATARPARAPSIRPALFVLAAAYVHGDRESRQAAPRRALAHGVPPLPALLAGAGGEPARCRRPVETGRRHLDG